jgi:hypothetical protein
MDPVEAHDAGSLYVTHVRGVFRTGGVFRSAAAFHIAGVQAPGGVFWRTSVSNPTG